MCAYACSGLGISSVQFANSGEKHDEALHGQFMLVVPEELQYKGVNYVQSEHLHLEEHSDKLHNDQQSAVNLEIVPPPAPTSSS